MTAGVLQSSSAEHESVEPRDTGINLLLLCYNLYYQYSDAAVTLSAVYRETLESTVDAVRRSSEAEHESVESRDTGINLLLLCYYLYYQYSDAAVTLSAVYRETLESTVDAVRRSSEAEHESVGSRDTGIDLNPDDRLPPVPVVGYHATSSDRRLLNAAHRRRPRPAAADAEPRVIDADDETDDPSSVKDGPTTSRHRCLVESVSE